MMDKDRIARESMLGQLKLAVSAGATPGTALPLTTVILATGIAFGRMVALGQDPTSADVTIADWDAHRETDFAHAVVMARRIVEIAESVVPQ